VVSELHNNRIDGKEYWRQVQCKEICLPTSLGPLSEYPFNYLQMSLRSSRLYLSLSRARGQNNESSTIKKVETEQYKGLKAPIKRRLPVAQVKQIRPKK
jgi:hypothetical protein